FALEALSAQIVRVADDLSSIVRLTDDIVRKRDDRSKIVRHPDDCRGGTPGHTLATMKGKVCVITGGTDGIGKAAAYGLAMQGARLFVHGRDPDKGARAVAELKS